MEVVKDPDNSRDRELIQMVNRYQGILLRMCYVYLRDMESGSCFHPFSPNSSMSSFSDR